MTSQPLCQNRVTYRTGGSTKFQAPSSGSNLASSAPARFAIASLVTRGPSERHFLCCIHPVIASRSRLRLALSYNTHTHIHTLCVSNPSINRSLFLLHQQNPYEIIQQHLLINLRRLCTPHATRKRQTAAAYLVLAIHWKPCNSS